MRNRSVVVVVLLIAAITSGALWLDHRHAEQEQEQEAQRREQEWRHGGDAVQVGARLTVTDGADFRDTLAGAGGRRSTGVPFAVQAFVIRVEWSRAKEFDGQYVFVLVDARKAQTRPFLGTGNWEWRRAYVALAEHYPWLASTAPDALMSGTTIQPIPVRAQGEGRATVAFWIDEDGVVTRAPLRDLRLAMFYVDSHGEVRWAKKVPLRNAR